MFDPDFDPLTELKNNTHNVNELIRAINTQSLFLKQLSQQHETMALLLKDYDARIRSLELVVESLKHRLNEGIR